jgi:hypothetical protein
MGTRRPSLYVAQPQAELSDDGAAVGSRAVLCGRRSRAVAVAALYCISARRTFRLVAEETVKGRGVLLR